MFYIKLADLNIKIDNKYPQLEKLCFDYLVAPCSEDFFVSASDEELNREIAGSDLKISKAYAESICIYRNICTCLTNYNAFVFHASVVEYEGRAYAFTAKSGTGKSTHSLLWLDCFNGSRIINGDKPIIRLKDNKFFVYGTPWCGKEGFNVNSSAELSAICFIERNVDNNITKIDSGEALGRIFNQLLIPKDKKAADKFLYLLDILLTKMDCYLLHCNISKEAAYIAYKGMNYIKEEGIYEKEE